MNGAQRTLRTARGDTVLVSLIDDAGQRPSVLVTLDDPDQTAVPTAEFTIKEAAELREILRELCEQATRSGGPRWATGIW